MNDDSDRVFDVSKPHRVSPDATAKPVIMGHQPLMNDPMMKNDAAPETPMPPSEHKTITVQAPDENESLPSQPPEPPVIAPEHPESVAAVTPAPEMGPSDGPPAMPDTLGSMPETSPLPPAAAEDSSSDMHLESVDDFIGHEHKLPQYFTEAEAAPDPAPQDPESPEVTQPMPAHQPHRSHGKKPKWWVVAIVLLVIGYLVIDSQTSISLPFNFFGQSAPAATTPAATSPATTATSTPTVPAGFTSYVIPNTAVSFDYPTLWGTPTTATDGGFDSRSTTAKSDGTYAYLVNFAATKDVQVAVTSSKYLPPTRGALYYDYLQWCVGTNDSKFYKSTLHFNTAAGVDTPSTVTCDQGPMLDATNLDTTTIVQLKTKNPDGSALGDLYTKNLNSTSLPVLRVKDAASTNSVNIKQLLNTVAVTAPAQ